MKQQTIFLVVGANYMLRGFSYWAFSTREKAEAFMKTDACQYISDEAAINELVVDEKADAAESGTPGE
jgi:hypothetical protein